MRKARNQMVLLLFLPDHAASNTHCYGLIPFKQLTKCLLVPRTCQCGQFTVRFLLHNPSCIVLIYSIRGENRGEGCINCYEGQRDCETSSPMCSQERLT